MVVLNRYELKVLPRTRGFTHSRALQFELRDGSSAHARVHRRNQAAARWGSRFFRVRTGSPQDYVNNTIMPEVLPRTRGFTH